MQGPSLGKTPWRRAWQPTPVFLPGGSHGQRSLAGCSPRGHKDSDTTERLTTLRNICCEVIINYKHSISFIKHCIYLLLTNNFLFKSQFQLQMFDIVCSTSWANKDKCCELPALVRILLSLFLFFAEIF